jgi:hypothetical protein
MDEHERCGTPPKVSRTRIEQRRQMSLCVDVLRMCFGSLSSADETRLFDDDGRLIDADRLRRQVSLKNHSHRTRQLIWPYLLNVYTPSMSTAEKNASHTEMKHRYER